MTGKEKEKLIDFLEKWLKKNNLNPQAPLHKEISERISDLLVSLRLDKLDNIQRKIDSGEIPQ